MESLKIVLNFGSIASPDGVDASTLEGINGRHVDKTGNGVNSPTLYHPVAVSYIYRHTKTYITTVLRYTHVIGNLDKDVPLTRNLRQ